MFIGYFVGPRMPGSIIIISSTLILMGTLGFRILFRIYRRLGVSAKIKNDEGYKRVLIIGAGDAAALIIKEIRNHKMLKIKVVGLIDDDEFKQNSYISGYPVLGKSDDMVDLVIENEIDEITFAIPSINHNDKKRIFEIANLKNAKLKTMPGMYELMENGFNYSSIRDVDVTDLLGRKEIKLNNQEISKYITGRTVLVTGGGGSIGSELCR